MKFKLKLLIIIFAFTQFQNSIYSAEILKTAANFVKEIPKKILTDRKLQRNILKAAVVIIPITITFIKLTKRIKHLENNPTHVYVTQYRYVHGDDCECDDCDSGPYVDW